MVSQRAGILKSTWIGGSHIHIRNLQVINVRHNPITATQSSVIGPVKGSVAGIVASLTTKRVVARDLDGVVNPALAIVGWPGPSIGTVEASIEDAIIVERHCTATVE